MSKDHLIQKNKRNIDEIAFNKGIARAKAKGRKKKKKWMRLVTKRVWLMRKEIKG